MNTTLKQELEWIAADPEAFERWYKEFDDLIHTCTLKAEEQGDDVQAFCAALLVVISPRVAGLAEMTGPFADTASIVGALAVHLTEEDRN